MVKYTEDYIRRMDAKVNCDRCGRQMRLGERISNIRGNVCAKCACQICKGLVKG